MVLTVDAVVIALILGTMALLGWLIVRPPIPHQRASAAVSMVAFIGLPALCVWAGTSVQLENSQRTDFCLSCHVMQDYGASMEMDDPTLLAAPHFQNHWVDQKRACYECHTTYTMYGGIRAKWNGVKHLWVNYIGTVPDPIELYGSYRNGDCLRCHGEARGYLDSGMHADLEIELAEDTTSCLDCHGPAHAIDRLGETSRWPHPLISGTSP